MEGNLLLEQFSRYKKLELEASPFHFLLDANIELNPHQINAFCAAIQALKTGGIVLADEVGLGKTIEAGLVLKYVLESGAKRVLIALPASLRKQWELELEDKFGLESVILDRLTVEKDGSDWRKRLTDNKSVRIVLTSYDYSSKLMKRFPEVKWDFIIIDEAHNLRNVFHGTKRAKNLYELSKGIPKILLTATPLQNSLTDLHGLVSFIDQRIFGSEKVFNKRYIEGQDYSDLKRELSPVLYRTLRKDVAKYMNFKKRTCKTVDFTLSQDEIELYQRVNDFLKRELLYSIPTSNRGLIKRASPAGFKVINPGPLTVTDYILLYAKDKTLMKYIPQRIPVGYDENYNLIINNPNDGPENWSFSKLVDLLYEQYGFKSWKDASNAWGTNWKTVRNSLLGDVALKNADRVVSVRDPHKPSQLIKEKMIESKSNGGKVIEIKRDGMRPIYIFEGGSLSFYKDKLRQIDGELTPTEVLTDFWADINFAGMAKEGAVQFKNSKKPEKLIKRILELSTEEGDLVLDSFAGSATTAAVSLKMKRKFITIELAPHCYSHCLPRLMRVVDGEQSGISKAVNWNGGGGFKFYELAPSLLVKNDKLPIYQINPSYTFEMLCEAICKIEGFRYKPQDVFHGHSSEKRFIHITTEFVNAGYIKSLSARLAEGQSLLIYGTKIQSDMILPDNIEVKKIPKDLLEKCDFESEVQ